MKILFTLAFLLSLNARANDLTLFFVPSPEGINWNSPSELVKSALKNKITFHKRFIGHVFVELICGEVHELTGMTGDNFDYLNQLLIGQKGLGIMYHSFPGALEKKEEIQEELTNYLNNGYANFAKFDLNEKQCQRASQYLFEYREKKVDRHYGLANRPRFGEGAGCSAFGVSFLEVLDLLDQDMKESWSRTINIPLEFSGPPLKEEGVGIFNVMFNAKAWAKESEAHKKLSFWDPDKMHAWVKEKIEKDQINYTKLKKGRSVGIVFDKTYFPSPEGPIWLQHLDSNIK
jgi:hypothetical protein